MPSRLSIFTSEELAEIIYRMDLAGTIEPLPPEAETLLQEFVSEFASQGRGVSVRNRQADELTEREPE